MFEIANMDTRPEMSRSPETDEWRMPEAKEMSRPSEYRSLNCDLDLNEFVWMNADESPAILRQTFAMRYSVYCLERNYLNPDHYDDNYETDEFDDISIHLAIRHKLCSDVTATARIVVSDTPDRHAPTLPLYRHCDVEPKIQHTLTNLDTIGEVSRLAISKSAIHHAINSKKLHSENGFDDLTSVLTPTSANLSAMLVLYKSIYQTSRVNGINYLLAAMEKSLRRLFQKFHFPFHQIGKEVDYYGPVAPFILDLNELDAVLSARMPWLLAEFRDGLDDNASAYGPKLGARFVNATTEI